MKKRFLSFIINTLGLSLIMLGSQAGWSCPSVSLSCPSIANIKGARGTFVASEAQGEWIGVLSSTISDRLTMQSFERGLMIQEGTTFHVPTCSYRLSDSEQLLDMYYTPDAHHPTPMTVVPDGAHWKKEAGPFGLTYGVCEGVSPTECTFTLQVRPSPKKALVKNTSSLSL